MPDSPNTCQELHPYLSCRSPCFVDGAEVLAASLEVMLHALEALYDDTISWRISHSLVVHYESLPADWQRPRGYGNSI